MNTNTFTHAYHVTQPDGMVTTLVVDNDDNDDGIADEKIEHYELPKRSREDALRHPFDKTHLGCAGRRVRVFLDGVEIIT